MIYTNYDIGNFHVVRRSYWHPRTQNSL